MKEPRPLTVKEYKFVHALFIEGRTLEQCQRIYSPKSKMSPMNMTKEGYKTKMYILKKIGSWSEVFATLGLGEERVSRVISGALTANKIIIRGEQAISVEDWAIRMKAASELVKIHGMADETVNVKMDITAKDVAENRPYIEMVADVMARYRKDNDGPSN